MNIKKIILISIALLIVASSLAMISAADSDNIEDVQSTEASDEIQGMDENPIIESDDANGRELTMDEASNVIGEASNTTQKTDNVAPKITFSKKKNYFANNKFTIRLTDKNTKKGIFGATVNLKFSNGKTMTLKTKGSGYASYSVDFNPGKYKVTATYNGAKFTYKFKILKPKVKISVEGKTRYYGIGYFKIHVREMNSIKQVKGADILLIVGKGKNARTFKFKSGKDAKYNMADLKPGKHKVVIKLSKKQVETKDLKTYIKIKKYKAKIYAKSQTKTKNQSYTIKLAKRKVLRIHDARIKIKITNGVKTKTLHKRTDSKGTVKINLKNFDLGTYKLKISSKTTAVKAKPVETTLKITG